MSSERRFLTGMRETDTAEAGLVLEDDGKVWKVAQDGARTEVGASDGSAGASGAGLQMVASAAIDLSGGSGIFHPAWDTFYDNTYSGNPIASLPTGLGIDFPLDGTFSNFNLYDITEAGAWWFDLSVDFPPDPDIVLRLAPAFPAAVGEGVHGPGLTGATNSGATEIYWGAVVALPAGDQLVGPNIKVFTPPSASPLMANVSGTIVRIA